MLQFDEIVISAALKHTAAMASVTRFTFLATAIVFHFVYFYSIFDIYFVSPVVSGMQLIPTDRPASTKPPADRLVLFVGKLNRIATCCFDDLLLLTTTRRCRRWTEGGQGFPVLPRSVPKTRRRLDTKTPGPVLTLEGFECWHFRSLTHSSANGISSWPCCFDSRSL